MTPTDDAAAERLLDDYRQAGGAASTIPDIPNRGPLTADVIAVLAEWLAELESRWPGQETKGRDLARLCIIYALTCKESRKTAAIPALISQFDRAKQITTRSRSAAGIALYDIPAGKEHFDEMAAIAGDRSFGRDRQMVVRWLGKSRHPDAIAVALTQLDDPTVQLDALHALSKLRPQGVREQIEPFLTSEQSWKRRLAKKILEHDQS